jgi:uncharacterized protein YcnI
VPVRPLRALIAVIVTTVAVLAVGVGTASAHVRVSSADATPGGYGEMTFRVPNESDTASTVSLRVQIPSDTPLASVSVKPVPGWTATTTTGPVEVHGSEVSEAVTEITWTADPGAGIAPGQYQTFSISGGPIPEVDQLVFPTIQTYDDGMEQAWIEPTVEGQEEPQSPAPVLALTGEGSGDSHGGDADSTDTASASDTDATATGDSDGSGLAVTALVVGALGLVAGIAGLGLALANRRRAG